MNRPQEKFWNALQHLWPSDMQAIAVQTGAGHIVVTSRLDSGRPARSVLIRFSSELLMAFSTSNDEQQGRIMANAEKLVQRSLSEWQPAMGAHADPLVISLSEKALGRN